MTSTILNLEVVENGSQKSLIADDGTIYATGGGSAMLLSAAYAARRNGFEAIMIEGQTWEVAAIIAAND